MPKRLLTYRCLIISPSDVDAERAAVREAITKWNAHTGPTLDVRIEAVGWETHAAPELGGRPQGIVNKIVDDCDLAVAIFWTRLGTPTGGYDSGSMEEIERLVEKGARVAVYFSERAMPTDVDLDQLDRLRAARGVFEQQGGLVWSFDSVEKLCEIVQGHVTMAIGELIQRDRSAGQTSRFGVATAPVPDVRVSLSVKQPPPPWREAMRKEDPPLVTYLRVLVENHSPSPVFIVGVSFEISDETLGTSQQSRVQGGEKRTVQQWDSAEYLYTPARVRAIAGTARPIAVIAHDAIGHRFRGGLDLPALLVEAERLHEIEQEKKIREQEGGPPGEPPR